MKRFLLTDDEGVVSEVDHAWIDGYPIGDRMLEGLWFKITITTDNKFQAEVDSGSAEYFSTLNERKWLNEVLDCCSVGPNSEYYHEMGGEPDVVCDDPDVPTKAEPKQEPVVVRALSPLDLFGGRR